MFTVVLNRRLWVAGLLMLAAAGGCGTAPLGQETTTLDVAFDRTGTLQSDGVFTPMTAAAAFDVIRVGDGQNNLALRAFISINLNSLPANSTVTNALLQFEAAAPAGNPFGDFVTLTVDHVNVVSGIGVDDFVGGTVEGRIATIGPVPTFDRRAVSIDVTRQVNADRAAGRPISSFRILFGQAPTADGQADAVFIDASDNDGGPRPSAQVTFRR